MKIVTADEMRAIDRATTEKYGIASLALMEHAGAAVAEFALNNFEFGSVCAVCGRGNNGGDGFVAARRLHEAGKKVSLIALGKGPEELRGDAAEMFRKLPVTPLWVAADADFTKAAVDQALQADLLLDAILGTGFRPPLKGIAARAISVINDLGSPVLAVDLPSGYDADEWRPSSGHARADAVVTFTAAKQVHLLAPITQGPIVVAPIGTPEEAIHSRLPLIWAGSYRNRFKLNRPLDANKGEFGHVFVIGGSTGKAGAPAMAAHAALKVGAGLVTACVPRSILPTVAQFNPEVMTEALAETGQGTVSETAADLIASQKSRARVVAAVGPGLSTNTETVEYVRRMVAHCDVPLILDADGLNAFAGKTDLLNGSRRPLVLTPHPGEMARLTGLSIQEILGNPIERARDFAMKYELYLVLKTWRTVVAHPDGRVAVSTTGNPGMAKGGTGDVLTGVIAGIIAQGRAGHSDIGEDVCRAVDLHGLSGDFALSERDDKTLMATDIIRCLPRAIRFIRSPQDVTWLRGFPKTFARKVR